LSVTREFTVFAAFEVSVFQQSVRFIHFIDLSFVLLTHTLPILCLETRSHALSVVVDYATTIYFALKEVIRQCSGGEVIVRIQFVSIHPLFGQAIALCHTWE